MSATTTGYMPGLPGTGAQMEDELEIAAPKGAARRLLRSLIRPHMRRVCLTTVVLLLQQGASLAGPVLVALTIDRAIPDLRAGDGLPLAVLGVSYSVCAIGSGVLQRGFVRLSARISQDVLIDLRLRLFSKIQEQSVDFHERHPSGQLISRATTDIEALRELLDSGLDQVVSAVVALVYISAILLILDWQLGLAALVAMAPVYLTMRSFRRRARLVYHRRSTASATLTTRIAETLGGIRTVQAYHWADANDKTLSALNSRHRASNVEAGHAMARYVTHSRLVANVAIAGLVLWGGYSVASGRLALGAFAGSVLYLRTLYDEPLQLGGVLDAYQSGAASLEKIAVLLATQSAVVESSEPVRLPARPAELHGRRVTFERVRFSYGGGREVISVLDLDIAAGETVALTGATGAGKSTLTKLIARFQDPTAGRVLLDGIDLRRIAAGELREEVVMLPQDASLFSVSIAENIALGRPGATLDEIERAAIATGAHSFVSQLPGGYQHLVAPNGGGLSSGQRQLIALSRAFLADPSVMILDESTSALDIPSERAVQTGLRAVLEGRTALLVAHRLSTVQIASRVLVVVGGKVVDDCAPSVVTSAWWEISHAHRA
ncbi:MAG: ABC transporter ATP-binding protein [Acidimicrobiales bacterium]